MPTPQNPVPRAAAQTYSNQQVTPVFGTIEQQPQASLFPISEVEFDGVQMGVLSDGTPYLTMRGLARMCGVDNAVLFRLTTNWAEERFKPRGRKIQDLLTAHGFSGASLFIMTRGAAGETHAYPDSVCMAVLEYYAFETQQGEGTEIAARNFRLLARGSFRDYIYKRCNYDPAKKLSDSWQNFHERVLLNSQLPHGYFSIFKEIAELGVRMIQAGFNLDSHTVPDGSVGICWAKHWDKNRLDSLHGERMKHPHNYPDWFPQAAANPIPAWVYPDAALAAFRDWMYRVYMPEKFPTYVDGKVKRGDLLPHSAKTLLAAVSPQRLA